MNRLKKELTARGIIYQNDDQYEEGRELVTVTPNFIITLWGCNVLPTEIHLFDKQFNLIAKQNLIPEDMFFQEGKTWNSYVFGKEDIL